MDQLRQSLTQADRAAIGHRPQVLHGLGGIEKTRLAVECGLANAEHYNALLFVSGETPEALKTNLANLGGVLGLQQAESTEDEVRVRAALEWLKLHPGWFLIVDNLDTPEALSAAEKMLADLSGGHTVMTRRLANFSGLFAPLEMDVLGPDDASAFLLERTGGKRRPLPNDTELAHDIAKDLGWLALALEQAGAYIVQRRRTLLQYRKDWVSSRDAVQAWFDPSVTDYPQSFAITWQTSIAQLTPPGLRMLQ